MANQYTYAKKKFYQDLLGEIMQLPDYNALNSIWDNINNNNKILASINEIENQHPNKFTQQLKPIKDRINNYQQTLNGKTKQACPKIKKATPAKTAQYPTSNRSKNIFKVGAAIAAASFITAINLNTIKSTVASIIGKSVIGFIAAHALPIAIGILVVTCIAATVSMLIERKKQPVNWIEMTAACKVKQPLTL